MKNPFVTKGYAGPEYFCDRVKETEDLVKMLTNENNMALISPRRIGKTTFKRLRSLLADILHTLD